MDEAVPARQAMAFYFDEKSHKGRSGNVCTLPSVLSEDFKTAFNKSMKTKSEYEAMVELAQNKTRWDEVIQQVKKKFCESRVEKAEKKRESRKKAEAKRQKEKERKN